MTNTLFTPRNFEEFKEQINNRNSEAAITIRWNDLNEPIKDKLITAIKKYSYSWTVKHHPNATETNIKLVFDNFNPLIEQTHLFRHSTNMKWCFGGAYISSRHWLDKLSVVIILNLRLRKLKSSRLYDYLVAYAGWGSYSLITEYMNILNPPNPIPPRLNSNIEPQTEISLSEITNTSQRAINNRTNH